MTITDRTNDPVEAGPAGLTSTTRSSLRRASVGLRSEAWIGRVLVAITAALLLVIWHVWASSTSPLILPKPLDVLNRLIEFVGDGSATPHIKITLEEIALGFALGGVAGIGLGTLAAEFGIARRLIMPYVIITQALPKFALAPIFVIWFGFGIVPKVIIAALIAFFPLLENTFLGLRSAPSETLELFRALRSNRWTTLIKCKLPNAVPAIFSGLRVALMLSLVGAVVAEYVGANKGLGALIIVAQGTLDTELMFVAFVLLTSLGFLLDKVHGLVYRLTMKRLYGATAVKASASGVSV